MLIGMPGNTHNQNSHLFRARIRFDVIDGVLNHRIFRRPLRQGMTVMPSGALTFFNASAVDSYASRSVSSPLRAPAVNAQVDELSPAPLAGGVAEAGGRSAQQRRRRPRTARPRSSNA